MSMMAPQKVLLTENFVVKILVSKKLITDYLAEKNT